MAILAPCRLFSIDVSDPLAATTAQVILNNRADGSSGLRSRLGKNLTISDALLDSANSFTSLPIRALTVLKATGLTTSTQPQ
jgi:hypothetical protein